MCRRLLILSLLGGCGGGMGLPKGTTLTPWGQEGDVVTSLVNGWEQEGFVFLSHPTDPGQLLMAAPGTTFLADADQGAVKEACLGTFIVQTAIYRAGTGFWDWDGETLRGWIRDREIVNCSGFDGFGELWSHDIEPFPYTYAYAEGGLVTWDQARDSLVRLDYSQPGEIATFGALPTPIDVKLRDDDVGLWAVVQDGDHLVVYEVDADSETVAERMNVPIGGTFDRIGRLQSGILVWKTDTAWWGASVAAGGLPHELALTDAPNNMEPWFDGKGFVLERTAEGAGPVSVNLSNGRLYSNGIALRNGMHVALEEATPGSVTVTWTSNTDAHGPDDGVLLTEVLDVSLDPSPHDPLTTYLTAAAYDNGACTVAKQSVGAWIDLPFPWKANVTVWHTDESTLYAGPCAGKMDKLAAGIATQVVRAPGLGAVLVAARSVTVEDPSNVPPGDYTPTEQVLYSGWALDSGGKPHGIYKSAPQATPPGLTGLVWFGDMDAQL